MGWYGSYGFRPYVSVAKRRANAAKEMAKLAKKGRTISPVKIEGLKIAKTFWGKAWCDNLESYSDYENRIPRGRTYVRNGSVVDLQIEPGRVTATVSGSELYDIDIKIKPLADKVWLSLKGECGGQIGSLVELLQGRLSQGVMELVTRHDTGLFPKPAEISMECSCPDGARMCKHVAAVLYGVGARLDERPELLFALRKVDHLELIAEAGAQPISTGSTSAQPTIAAGDLADVFGIEIETPDIQPAKISPPSSPTRSPKSGTRVVRAAAAETPVSRKKTKNTRRTNPPGVAASEPAKRAIEAPAPSSRQRSKRATL